jgi:hypothetical protein
MKPLLLLKVKLGLKTLVWRNKIFTAEGGRLENAMAQILIKKGIHQKVTVKKSFWEIKYLAAQCLAS